MSTIILARLLDKGADLDIFGHSLAPQPHGLNSFCYRVPGPRLDALIEDPSGSITIASGAPPSGFSPAWAPAALQDLVEDERARFAIGEPIEDAEKQARNEAAIASRPKVDLPPRAPLAFTCAARRVMQREVMRELVVDWAVPVERAAQLAPRRISGPCPFEYAELLAMGHELESDPRGCTSAWGAESEELDAGERAVRLAQERAREAEEERARAWSTMNTATCDERGVFVVMRRRGEPHLGPMTGDTGGWRFPGAADGEPHADEHGTTYHVFESDRLAGLRLDDPRILEGDAVPPIPIRYFERKAKVSTPVLQYLLRELRHGSIDDSPVTAFRDARTPDGRITGERLIARWKPLADLLCTDEGRGWPELFVQSWIRSCLPLDGGYAAYVAVVEDAWRRLHTGPANPVLEPAHVVHVDEYGRDWPEFQLASTIGAFKVEDSWYFQGRPKPLVPRTIPAVMWKAPPLPMSESHYLDLAARAVRGGEHALVGLNELVEEIEPGFLEKFKARFLPDPWGFILSGFIEGKPQVFANELEDALRSVGELDGVMPPRGFGRIRKIMLKLGWEDKQIPIAGRRKRAWVAPRGGK